LRTVRQRVRIQIGLHCSYGHGPRVAENLAANIAGDCRKPDLGQAEPKTFVGKEKERLLLVNRPAKRPTKIVLVLPRLEQAFAIRKPIVGIQNVVSKIVESRAVELVSAGTRYNRNLSSRLPPKFGRIRGGLYAKLLESIDRDKAVRAS